MIQGTTEMKAYQNLSKEQAQEICDVYFKSSIEMAIASLKNGLEMASKSRNIRLAKLITQDIETYTDMWAEREIEKIEREKEQMLFDQDIERLKRETYDIREDCGDWVTNIEHEKLVEEAGNNWENRNKL